MTGGWAGVGKRARRVGCFYCRPRSHPTLPWYARIFPVFDPCRSITGAGHRGPNARAYPPASPHTCAGRAGARCQFSYSADGRQFAALGPAFTAREGRWEAAKLDLFCLGAGGGGRGRTGGGWRLKVQFFPGAIDCIGRLADIYPTFVFHSLFPALCTSWLPLTTSSFSSIF